MTKVMALALAACVLAGGCATKRAALEQALHGSTDPSLGVRDRASRYLVQYPDTVEITVRSRPDCCGVRPVTVEGTLPLPIGDVSVAGLPVPEIARRVARHLGVDEADVHVRVTRHDSRQVFLVGPTGAIQKALPYRGPETVVELLRRSGGLEGADLLDVRVVRSHAADGKSPEVIEVDLHAILVKKETRTNVRLEPFDRVHVGQSPPARYACRLPPWLKPFWREMTETGAKGKWPVAGESE